MTAEQVFQSITAEDWKCSCQHVEKIEKEYYERGLTMYDEIDALVINLRDDSSSTESSESEDDCDVATSFSPEFSGIEYLDENSLDSD